MSNSIPSRKDTQETLVGSPIASTVKKQWPRSESPTKQSSMLYQNGSEAVTRNNIPRRSSTGKTLSESPGGKILLDNVEDLAQLKSDDLLITSPTSTTAPSTILSPDTPLSAVPPLSSSTSESSLSASTSPELLIPQRRIPFFAKKSGKSDGETLETLREGASLVARAVLSIAEASNIPYLKGVAGIASLILEFADGAAANKEECFRIIGSVSQLLETLKMTTVVLNGRAPKELEKQLDHLTSIFKAVLQDVKKLSDNKRGYFKKFMQMERDREIVKRCEARLQDAFRLFELQSWFETRTSLADIRIQMNQFNRTTSWPVEIRDLEQNEEGQRAWDSAGSQRATVPYDQRASEKPAFHLTVLPPCPEIFLGRDEILEQLVKSAINTSASRIAILGPGGIGKSSLALKLLHHKEVSSYYGENRFFVPCDSATSVEGLIDVLASQIGLSEGREGCNNRPGQREAAIIACLTSLTSASDIANASRPIIIVLDNLESPWEPDRIKVEEFLAHLAAVRNVTLIVTLRGAERPSNVKWSLPLLPPLQTLDPQASRNMFLSISGAEYKPTYTMDSPDELDELLILCGHLPLAIRLMAELAVPDIDTVPGLLKRWKRATRSTAMLSIGEDPVHSLEVSIELSLSSPRLKSVRDATNLLGLLALLPDGIREDDLETAVPHLDDPEKCSLTLIKTGLAYRDKGTERLKVLAPIRSYVASSSKYKLPQRSTKALESYFWRFIDRPGNDQRGEGSIRRALPELGNIENLIERALREDFEPSSAITAAVNLGQFFLEASLREPRLAQLQRALVLAEQIRNEKLQADCVYTVALAKHRHSEDAARCGDDFLKALALYEIANDKAGQGHCLHQLASFYHSVRKFEDARSSAEKAIQAHVEAGCLSGQASALELLASLLHMMNEPKHAIERAHEALAMLRTKYHDPILEARCLQILGNMHCTTFCNYVDARELLEESFRIYQALSLEGSSDCMNTTVSMGELALVCSRHQEAKVAFQKAADTYRKVKRRDWEAYALVYLGLACLGLESPGDALVNINAGLAIWESLRNKWGIGISYTALGDVAMYKGSFSLAQEHYNKALDTLRADSKHWDIFVAECLLKRGNLLIHLQQEHEARESLQDACRLYTACRRGKTNCIRKLAELDLKSSDVGVKGGALTQLEFVVQEYSEMGLHVEQQQCAVIVAKTYRSLGKKPSKSLQLQINA